MASLDHSNIRTLWTVISFHLGLQHSSQDRWAQKPAAYSGTHYGRSTWVATCIIIGEAVPCCGFTSCGLHCLTLTGTAYAKCHLTHRITESWAQHLLMSSDPVISDPALLFYPQNDWWVLSGVWPPWLTPRGSNQRRSWEQLPASRTGILLYLPVLS